jgi:hypothetical protein
MGRQLKKKVETMSVNQNQKKNGFASLFQNLHQCSVFSKPQRNHKGSIYFSLVFSMPQINKSKNNLLFGQFGCSSWCITFCRSIKYSSRVIETFCASNQTFASNLTSYFISSKLRFIFFRHFSQNSRPIVLVLSNSPTKLLPFLVIIPTR